MRNSKLILLVISLLVFSLVIGGCSLFPTDKTRPAPVRPRKTTSPTIGKITPTPISTPVRKLSGVNQKMRPAPMRPMPSKQLKGITVVTEKNLHDRVTRIERAAARKDWLMAKRETNTLGLEMTRFRPITAKGKSLREIASFDAIYARLQTDCRLQNQTAVRQDTERLRMALSGLKKTA